jgi:dienelactone hydrolase
VHFVDTQKADPVEPARKREIMAQYWYPTDQTGGARASYLPDAGLLEALLAQNYYMQSNERLNGWKDIQTHAVLDAPVSRRRKWPILLLEPGLGLTRASYTTFCEELASNGYFVAAIDPTRGGVAVLPDGRVLSANDDPALGDPTKQNVKTAEWSGDFSFILGQLLEQASHLSLDTRKVGTLGHSMGGSAALQAALDDRRILAAVDMDGSGGVVGLDRGARVPMLFLKSDPNYSDADLAKLGRTRAQWEAMGKRGPKMFLPLQPGTHSKPVYQISIQDTGHLSYSDAPFVMPDTITRFSSHSLPAQRTLFLVTRLTRGFFDHYLLGKPWPVIESHHLPWSEVTVTQLY